MKKSLHTFLFGLAICGYAAASDSYVLHQGLPKSSDALVTYSFKGTLNGTSDLSGSVIYKMVGPSTFHGQNATKINTTTKIRSKAESFYLDTYESEYASCNTSGCRYLGSHTSANEYKKPIQTFNVPYTARLGDSGLIGSYLNEDTTVDSCAWSLESADHGLATLTIGCTTLSGNEVTGAEITKIVIDRTGTCKRGTTELQGTDEDGLTTITANITYPADKYFYRFH